MSISRSPVINPQRHSLPSPLFTSSPPPLRPSQLQPPPLFSPTSSTGFHKALDQTHNSEINPKSIDSSVPNHRASWFERRAAAALSDVASVAHPAVDTTAPSTPTAASAHPNGLTTSEQFKLLTDELVSTERTYKRQLHTLNNLFIVRLRTHSQLGRPILTNEEILKIFGNADELAQINEKFYQELKALRSQGALYTSALGHLISKYASSFRSYITYIYGYDDGNRTLQVLRDKKPEFDWFVRVNESCERSRIEDFLILPVQRIPRYILLLRSLSNYCEGGVEGEIYGAISSALYSISSLTTDINDTLRAKQSRSRVIDLQAHLTGEPIQLVSEHRLHIHSGLLNKKYNNNQFKRQSFNRYMFHLLTDILLYTTVPNQAGHCKLKYILPLSDLTIMAVQDGTMKGNGHLFEIRSSSVKSFIVSADTDTDKTKWMEVINAAIDELQAKKEKGSNVDKSISSMCRGSFSVDDEEENSANSAHGSISLGESNGTESNLYNTSPLLMQSIPQVPVSPIHPRPSLSPPPIPASLLQHRYSLPS